MFIDLFTADIFYCAVLCIVRTILSQDVCQSVCHATVFCRNG